MDGSGQELFFRSVSVEIFGGGVAIDTPDDTSILVFVAFTQRNGVVARTPITQAYRAFKDKMSHRVACVDRRIGVVLHLVSEILFSWLYGMHRIFHEVTILSG